MLAMEFPSPPGPGSTLAHAAAASVWLPGHWWPLSRPAGSGWWSLQFFAAGQEKPVRPLLDSLN